MANKNNNINFNIPVPIILLALAFCAPVGILLIILRSMSIPVNTKNPTIREEVNRSSGRTNTSSKKKRSKGKNQTTATKALRFFAIFLAIAGAIITFGELGGGGITPDYFRQTILPNCGLFFTGAAACGIASKIFSDRDSRFGRIRAIIGNRESINLTKLATASNEKLKNVRKDVQKMIDDGEFGEYAYIDLGTNNFMRSPYAEPDEPESFDYRKVYGEVLKKEKKQSEKSAEEIATETTSKEADNDDFTKIILEIRRLNDEIADAKVSERIDQIEEHTKNIFEYVTDHPDAMPQIRTFMNYYLPTTLKLLESYSRIERVGVAGENMKKSKEKIESILDLLVIGFEQQVDQLFKNESIDISSDIRVLETMMQKDGLSGKNDFDTSKFDTFTDGYTDEISDIFGGAAAQSAPSRESDTGSVQ